MQWLRHQRENEQGQAKIEWKNHILVRTASPTKAKEASIDGDVEVGVLEINRHCPIARAKKCRRIPDHVHPEVGSIVLVEPL